MSGLWSDLQPRLGTRRARRLLAAAEACFAIFAVAGATSLALDRKGIGAETAATRAAIETSQTKIATLPKLVAEEADLRAEKQVWEESVGAGDPPFEQELDGLITASGVRLLDFRSEKLGRTPPEGFAGSAYRLRLQGGFPETLAFLQILPARLPLAQPLQIDLRPGTANSEVHCDMLFETFAREDRSPEDDAPDPAREERLLAEAQAILDTVSLDPFFPGGPIDGLHGGVGRGVFTLHLLEQMQAAVDRGEPEVALALYRAAAEQAGDAEPPREVAELARYAQAMIDFEERLPPVHGVGVAREDAVVIVGNRVYAAGESIDEETVVTHIDLEKVEFLFRGFRFERPVRREGSLSMESS